MIRFPRFIPFTVSIGFALTLPVMAETAPEPKAAETAPEPKAAETAPEPKAAETAPESKVAETASADKVEVKQWSEAEKRANIQERITNAALAAMLVSSDGHAVMLAAKYARMADLPPGKVRNEAEQHERQGQTLERAMRLAKTKVARAAVDFEVAMFCSGLPRFTPCRDEDRVLALGKKHGDNAAAWLMVAASEFGQGHNDEAGNYLAMAAKARASDWYYREAMALGLRYAKAAKIDGAVKGDHEVAAFNIAGQLTIPAFSRFSQMCSPDAEGKLPDGRYEACRKVADILISKASTNVELIVAYKALQRMADGEKKTDDSTLASGQLTALQAANKYIWDQAKFPPVTAADAKALSAYVSDLIAVGEVKATHKALARLGKKVSDFLPKS